MINRKTGQADDEKQDKRKFVITIVNYNKFQSSKTSDGTSDSTGNDTSDGQATDKRRYKNKNEKNEKKQKTPSGYSPEFDEAWAIYPRKDGKRNAFIAWQKAIKRDMPVDKMVLHIESRMYEPDWRKEEGKYVPHMATSLNRDGWLDEGAAITPPQDDNEPTYGLDFYDGAPEHMRPKPPKPKAVLS
jgi:hypothetical protein